MLVNSAGCAATGLVCFVIKEEYENFISFGRKRRIQNS